MSTARVKLELTDFKSFDKFVLIVYERQYFNFFNVIANNSIELI